MIAGAMGVADELAFQIVRLAYDTLLEPEGVWREEERFRPYLHSPRYGFSVGERQDMK